MRGVRRPRRYVASRWLKLTSPIFRYSRSRNAYVLRAVGNQVGPVLRADRRHMQRRHLKGPERRQTRAA